MKRQKFAFEFAFGLSHVERFKTKLSVMGIKIYFGVHNKQIKVYAVVNGKRKNKALSFFGDAYKVATSVEYWNKANECFNTHISRNIPIPTAQEDNKRLEELKRILEQLTTLRQYSSCEDFFAAYKVAMNVEAAKVPTLLEFAQTFCQLWKDNKVMGKFYKHKSGNYVIYQKFVRRLQGYQYKKLQPWANEIKAFANKAITEITNKDYNDFIFFLETNNLPVRDSQNAFRATVYYYRQWIMNDDDFKFNLSHKHKSYIKQSKENRVRKQTLSEYQLKQLAELDTTAICPKMDDARKQLYKDTLILMYGLVTRPYDILSMKIEDIKKDRYGNGYNWEYCAHKLLNTKGEVIATPIQESCMKIVQAYKGKRKNGFLLPFNINKTEKEPQQRKIQINHTATLIGKFFKEVAKHYNWDIDTNKLSMYTLRHTAITDLLKHYNITIVANWGHTSVKEINETYMDKNNIATYSCPNHLNFI